MKTQSISSKKISIFITALMVVALPLATAQPQTNQTDVGPGIISADSPLYGLETALDNAAVSIGLKKAGEVAQERAAEARKAANEGKPNAAGRAAKSMQNIAAKADGQGDEENVQKAMDSLSESRNILQEKMQEAPNEQARQGMQTALDNMQGALDNMEKAKQERDEARQQRDQDMPQTGGQNTTQDQQRDRMEQNMSSEEKVNQAEDFREDARQDLREGKQAMDSGDFEEARNQFGEASQKFTDAIDTLEGVNTSESSDLVQQLEDARNTAEDARTQAGQNIDSVRDTNQTQGDTR